MSGQRSLRGGGGDYGASGGPGRHSRPLRLHCRRGLRVPPHPAPDPPAPPHGTAPWLGGGGESRQGRQISPARTAQPLLRSSPPSPRRAPPPPQAEWCGPPPADPPGIPARSSGLAPACAPAPSPSPRPAPPAAAAAASASSEGGSGPAAVASELRRRRRRAPWETPGASAAKRPACRLAVPAASGGPARL